MENKDNHTEQKGWREFDCEELEELINDVRSGVKDSAHIHSFVRREIERTLQEYQEELVKKTEKLQSQISKKELSEDKEQWTDESKAAYYYLDEALSLIKDTKI